MTKPTFDMEAAIEALRAGKDLTGKDGILTPLIKQLTEAALNVELDQHLEGVLGILPPNIAIRPAGLDIPGL